MPPPNITGRLHLGHALDLGLQDALIRRARSLGAQTSWIAGCDHAGQSSHEKLLEERPDLLCEGPLGSEAYWAAARERAERLRGSIFSQLAALRPLADLSSPRFTLDAEYLGTFHRALETLIANGKISRSGESLLLDLRGEARALREDIAGGAIRIHPPSHANRLMAMLSEERLWEIGRRFPWSARARLFFGESGRCLRSEPADSEREGDGARDGELWSFDTWMHSALWPQAIEPGKRFGALIIGYDIAYFWAARMLMMARALGEPYPFSEIFLHGLIRDGQGRKFSKSLGNGIDPMEPIAAFGSDSLRLWALSSAAWGRDFRWSEPEIGRHSRFLTKIANACRLLELRAPERLPDAPESLSWPQSFRADGEAFEARLQELFASARLDEAAGLAISFSRSRWCEGFLSRRESLETPEAWLEAWGGARRLLALLHPFLPATSWSLDSWLSEIASERPRISSGSAPPG